jgi:hypothetical protein
VSTAAVGKRTGHSLRWKNVDSRLDAIWRVIALVSFVLSSLATGETGWAPL